MGAEPTNIEEQDDPDMILTAEEYVRGACSAHFFREREPPEGAGEYPDFLVRMVGVRSDVGCVVETWR